MKDEINPSKDVLIYVCISFTFDHSQLLSPYKSKVR